MVPASRQEPEQCLNPSQPLTPKPGIPATTLMLCSITVFQAGNDKFGILPSAEYDGDPAAIVHEFNSFQP